MKKTSHISLLLLLFYFMVSCHKIDLPVKTELTPDVFPQTPEQLIQASGPPYAALRGDFSLAYWFMQSLSTDEAILPARGSNWYDNQNYRMLHYHDWTRDHGWTGTCWTWLSRVIGTTNQTLSILETNIPPSTTTKASTLAELKMVRALAYFMMMDLYGNVPLDTLYGDFTPHPNVPRAQVFNFIEAEVKAAIPHLSDVVAGSTYGRATKYMAYALLAKMYLNAEVYTGTARVQDCIAACDNVISSNKFSIEPKASYLKMFSYNNGPLTQKEFIFAIPYDPAAASLPGTNGFMFHARYDVPRSHQEKFNLKFQPSAPESTLPEFYSHFNDANDERNKQWLTGLQFLDNGKPIMVKTTKVGYDQSYSAADKGDPYTYQVDLTPNLVFRNEAGFDVGNDELGWNMGYRNVKFIPDPISLNRNQSNDVPVFRYSDIILMKAEAILRGGAATLGSSAQSLVDELRINRTSSPSFALTLDELYAERSREFAWETWHRNDMIRFGKYEGTWGFKTNTDTYRRIFPIPTAAFVVNPSLKQNPGYN